VKYGLVDSLVQEKAVSLQRACELLGVSRSGYYAARKRTKQPVPVDLVAVKIKAAFAASDRAYGSRRLVTVLAQQGIRVGRYKVRQLMKAHNLHPVWKRRFVHTTNSKHGLPAAQNVLNRDFKPTWPDRTWAADITELVYHRRYSSRVEAEASIREYIEIFYNRQRRHSRLGNLSLAVFAQNFSKQAANI
jgi:transposase InsO family protein